MKVMDKFLNSLRLTEEDGDYDDDYLDDDDIDEEVVTKSASYKDKYDKSEETVSSKPATKITPIRTGKKQNGSSMQVCVIKPTSYDEVHEITDTLLANQTVVLNLEGLDVDLAQRIIDFTSGSTYAIDGKLQKISRSILLVTPATVNIAGDFQDMFGGALDY